MKWILILSAFFLFGKVIAQEKMLSIQCSNSKMEEVLEKLSNESRVLFSYNPDYLPQNARISKNFKSQPLALILNELLTPYHLQYQIMENMVIITPIKSPASEPVMVPVLSSPSPDTPRVRDSVIFIYDTITTHQIVHDTVFHTIHETRYDTIIIEKTVRMESKSGPFSLALSGGLASSVFSTFQADAAASTYQIESPSVALGLLFLFEPKKLGIGMGIQYNSLHFTNTSYRDTVHTFYEVDTTGSYYVIVDGQPEYHYFIDSTEHRLPISLTEHNSSDCQRLSFPLRVTYRLNLSKKVSLRIGGEVAIGLLISKNHEPVFAFNNHFIPQYAVITQMAYQLADNAALFLEGRYRGKSSSFLEQKQVTSAFVESNLGMRIFF